MDGNTGKCPVAHGATSTGTRSNSDWWPNQLNLRILHQNSEKSDPMGDGFDYAKAFKSLDLKAVKLQSLCLFYFLCLCLCPFVNTGTAKSIDSQEPPRALRILLIREVTGFFMPL